MFFVLTSYGLSIQNNIPTLGTLDYKLGDASGYTPDTTATGLTGAIVKTGKTASGSLNGSRVETSSLVKFSIVLDFNDGPYTFGEAALYHNGNLVAIGANSTPYKKIPQTYDPVSTATTTYDPDGNSITVDCYLPLDGNNPYGYGSVSNSDDILSVGRYNSVDRLPQAGTAKPNVWITPSPRTDPLVDAANADATMNVLCTTTDEGLWSIEGYEQIQAIGTLSANATAGATLVNYTLTQGATPALATATPGTYIIQFISGPSRGYVRTLTTASSTNFGLRVPLATSANTGDQFIVLASSRLDASALSILNGLSPLLTAAILNSLIDNPPNKMLRIDGANKMTAQLNFGDNRGVNLADPIDPKDAVNKGWVENFLSGAQGGFDAVLRAFDALAEKAFMKDGSVKATGNFVMGNSRITNMAQGVEDFDAVNLKQLKCFIADLSTELLQTLEAMIAELSSRVFFRDGSAPATGNFQMANFRITGLGNGVDSTDAVNKGQLDDLRDAIDGSETKIIESESITGSGNGTAATPYQIKLRLSPDEDNLLQIRANGVYYGTKAPDYIRNQYVDPVNGSDSNIGSRAAPLKTIAFAVKRIPANTNGNNINLHESGIHNWPSSEYVALYTPSVNFYTYGPNTDAAKTAWTFAGWPWWGSATAPHATIKLVPNAEVYPGANKLRSTVLGLAPTATILFAGIDIHLGDATTPAATDIPEWRGMFTGSGKINLYDSKLSFGTGASYFITAGVTEGSPVFNVNASSFEDSGGGASQRVVYAAGGSVSGAIYQRNTPGWNSGMPRASWASYFEVSDTARAANYIVGSPFSVDSAPLNP